MVTSWSLILSVVFYFLILKKDVSSCQDFHLTFLGPTRGELLEWVAEEKGVGVRTQNIEGVVWWSGGAVCSDIQLLSTLTQAGDVFLVSAWKLVIKISSHSQFASLLNTFTTGTLKWLRDWHTMKRIYIWYNLRYIGITVLYVSHYFSSSHWKSWMHWPSSYFGDR